MKILITGATGLVGREVADLCLGQNIAVNYLSTNKQKIISKENYHGFYWNPSTKEIDLKCFQGVSAIINLAGASIAKRWTKNYKEEILSSRIDSLRTLFYGLEKIDHSEITSFVSASAIGVYPNSLSSFYTEAEKNVDHSLLGEVVQAWEKEVDIFKKLNFNIVKIRIGLVLSSKGGALPEMARPINNYIGAAFGSGEQWQSWIHAHDLARMFLYVIVHKLEGTFNGVAPNPVTNRKLTKEIAKVMKKPLVLPNIPKFMMKLILGQMSYILFTSQRVSSKKIEEVGFDFIFQNIYSALEQIYTSENNESTMDSLYPNGYQ